VGTGEPSVRVLAIAEEERAMLAALEGTD